MQFIVTKIFHEYGWNGIYIESLDDIFNKLILRRTRGINLPVYEGGKIDETNLYHKSI